jgi:glutamate synthase (ferredoxin)
VDTTGSPRGEWILENWNTMAPKFIKVFPHEYKRVLGIARTAAPAHAVAAPVVPAVAAAQLVQPLTSGLGDARG